MCHRSRTRSVEWTIWLSQIRTLDVLPSLMVCCRSHTDHVASILRMCIRCTSTVDAVDNARIFHLEVLATSKAKLTSKIDISVVFWRLTLFPDFSFDLTSIFAADGFRLGLGFGSARRPSFRRSFQRRFFCCGV